MNITAAFKNQAGFGRRWIITVAVIVVAVLAIFFVAPHTNLWVESSFKNLKA
jgi:hypothetical protein